MAELFQRVRRVGDQLAHEDLLLRVERMDDDIEQLADLGLELEGLGSGHGEKGRVRVRVKVRGSRRAGVKEGGRGKV
jgi:hypothetical protein